MSIWAERDSTLKYIEFMCERKCLVFKRITTGSNLERLPFSDEQEVISELPGHPCHLDRLPHDRVPNLHAAVSIHRGVVDIHGKFSQLDVLGFHPADDDGVKICRPALAALFSNREFFSLFGRSFVVARLSCQSVINPDHDGPFF